jgi:hypothetical protein
MTRGLRFKYMALVIGVSALAPTLLAEGIPVGTWVRRPTKGGISATMLVEPAGAGQKLTYKITLPNGTSTMIMTTQYDGKDAQVYVDGKPSGETMAIRMVDDHHTTNVIKMNGNLFSTQKAELSADGKVIKVESTATGPGGQGGTEYWDKK